MVALAYSTTSKCAILVLTSKPQIDLAMEEKVVKKRARERLLEKWQLRWDPEKRSRWTHTLIQVFV